MWFSWNLDRLKTVNEGTALRSILEYFILFLRVYTYFTSKTHHGGDINIDYSKDIITMRDFIVSMRNYIAECGINTNKTYPSKDLYNIHTVDVLRENLSGVDTNISIIDLVRKIVNSPNEYYYPYRVLG